MVKLFFQFSRQPALDSEAIAWFSHGPVSHVDCILPSGELLGARVNKIGNIPAGVQIRPSDYAKFSLVQVLTVEVTNKQESDFYSFLYAQIGKPYDTKAIWSFVVNRNWRESDSWICSELQAAGVEAAEIVNPLYLGANKIDPVDFALIISAIGNRLETKSYDLH